MTIGKDADAVLPWNVARSENVYCPPGVSWPLRTTRFLFVMPVVVEATKSARDGETDHESSILASAAAPSGKAASP